MKQKINFVAFKMEKISAVGKMQKYILNHLGQKITLDDLGRVSGYSKFHAVRMFKNLSGETQYDYIRSLRLTKAAERLRDNGGKIIDVALESGFDSHDGFTRAFERRFGITPKRYAEEKPAIPYFIHRYVSAYYLLNKKDITMENERVPRTVTVTAVERPERKLILLRAKNTKDGCYESYCEEMGCEWEGLLNSIPEKFAPAGLLTLPDDLVIPGTSNTASGVEVPIDYAKPIPEDYDIITLNPCTMLFFQGSPYENEDDFGLAIEIAWQAIGNYEPTRYGYEFAYEIAPVFNFGANGKMGALQAVPVRAIEK